MTLELVSSHVITSCTSIYLPITCVRTYGTFYALRFYDLLDIVSARSHCCNLDYLTSLCVSAVDLKV